MPVPTVMVTTMPPEGSSGYGVVVRPMKLGRIIPKVRPQVLRFNAYFDAAKVATPPPAKVDYFTKAMASLRRVYLNDQYGDCVIASAYHQEGVWTGNDDTAGEQPAIEGTDNEVLTMYHRICGPGDNGCNIAEVLNYTRDRGLPFNNVIKKIEGYVSVDNTNKLEVQVAIAIFGSLKLGIDLPNAWTCTNCKWDVTNSNIVGGHDVPVVGYDDVGVQISTWGGLATITWAAFLSSRWISECYCVLAPDWYGQDNLAPNGIDAATLRADLAKLGGGIIPDPGPGPTPPIVCPPGQHWDGVACVPDVPVPPQPVPLHGVAHVPSTGVTVKGPFGITFHGTTDPVNAPVTFDTAITTGFGDIFSGAMVSLHLPPWLLAAIKLFCAGGAVVIPPPWNFFVPFLCRLLPANAEHLMAAGMGAMVQVPALFWTALRFLCGFPWLIAAIPNESLRQIITGLCGLVPSQATGMPSTVYKPCGCQ